MQEVLHYEYHILMLGHRELGLRNYEVSLEVRTDHGEGWGTYIPLCWKTPRDVPDDDDFRWYFDRSIDDNDHQQHQYSMSEYYLTTVSAHMIDKCHIFVLVWADEDVDQLPRFRVTFVDRWRGHVEVKSLHLTWERFILDLDDYFHPPDEAHQKYPGCIPRGVGRRATTVLIR